MILSKCFYNIILVIYKINYSDGGCIKMLLNIRNLYRYIPDKVYLKLLYYKRLHRIISFKNPKTFNEKLQWLKIFDRNPKYTKLVDKYEVRKYISDKIGEKYLIPLLGAWDNFDEIDQNALPDQFVLKCNHDSGGVMICKDKNKFDFERARSFFSFRIKNNYYYNGREWPYKNIKPKIMAEKYMEDSKGELVDYKFFCFDGKVDNVMVCVDRNKKDTDTKFYFFNQNWELLRLNIRGKQAPEGFTLKKPKCMDDMFAIASILSKGIPFVRIDLYECNEQIYFGEFTFYPDSGFDNNLLPETDIYLGNLLKIDNIRRKKS